MWKPSPWRRFPSKRGEWPICAVSGRLPAQHGCARTKCVQGFCGAKPCFGGIHFRQRMVDRGPHETGFMGQAILWKPSPWRKFPSKGGSDPYAPSPVAFRRSRSAPAGRAYKGFAEQNLALAGFISAKGWWIGAPMKRVSWGRRHCGSLHHGGDSPVNRGVARGERCSASTGLSTDSSQMAVGSRDTTQEPPPDAL